MDYTEDVDKAISILKTERLMREKVFKNDYRKKTRKVEEMNLVINMLRNYKRKLLSRTANLFGPSNG